MFATIVLALIFFFVGLPILLVLAYFVLSIFLALAVGVISTIWELFSTKKTKQII